MCLWVAHLRLLFPARCLLAMLLVVRLLLQRFYFMKRLCANRCQTFRIGRNKRCDMGMTFNPLQKRDIMGGDKFFFPYSSLDSLNLQEVAPLLECRDAYPYCLGCLLERKRITLQRIVCFPWCKYCLF